jgi:hypothetical protein
MLEIPQVSAELLTLLRPGPGTGTVKIPEPGARIKNPQLFEMIDVCSCLAVLEPVPGLPLRDARR